jgi:hypothetical protein
MPKFRVYLAASVDGYIAGAGGSVAWLDAFDGEGSDDAKSLEETCDQDPYGYELFYENIAAGLEGSKGDFWLIGGADVIGQFLDAGRVDSIEIFVMPVLLGKGIPTFPRDRSGPDPALELSESTGFGSGIVRLLYTAK